MKAKDVMKFLGITRTTLYNYVKSGKITGTKLENGYYDYDEKTVFKLMKKDNRTNIIYARVSTYKQKNDLKKQIEVLEKHCKNQNINDTKTFSEIASGLDLERKEFNKIIDLVTDHKVKNVYISHKDRLTRLSFGMIEHLFSKFGTKIIIINNDPSKSNDNEIFEELIGLMHIFSTTMYSRRRKNKINIYKSDIENFIN